MSEPAERLARLETWKDGHEDQCRERYQDIKQNTKDIKDALVGMATDLKSAVERIHGRIDGEAITARTATEGVASKISGQKFWILSTAVTVLVAIIAFLVDKVWK